MDQAIIDAAYIKQANKLKSDARKLLSSKSVNNVEVSGKQLNITNLINYRQRVRDCT
jgi:hypothetical protein